jgi:hypothetical protein
MSIYRTSSIYISGFIAMLTLAALALNIEACTKQRESMSRLRFCESFDSLNVPVGEDSVFTCGTLSVLVESGWPIDADKLELTILRDAGGQQVPYGGRALVEITRYETAVSIQDILSFADTGLYTVRVTSPGNTFIVNGRVRIRESE